MKFIHPKDTKAFLLGLMASITAVIIWDRWTRKDRKRFFNTGNNE
jgi:hypothetical protein